MLVRVDATPAAVEVEVVDDGPGPQAGSRRGFGLVGLAERVHALGGELSAGPGSGGTGFRVHAVLPRVGAVRR